MEKTMEHGGLMGFYGIYPLVSFNMASWKMDNLQMLLHISVAHRNHTYNGEIPSGVIKHG